MGNRQSLPQHGMPNLALSLMLNNFTEKKLRRQECYFYLMFMSLVQLVFFTIGCIVLSAISAFSKKQRPPLLRRIGGFAAFNALLLLVGAIFNGVWSCTIWGR